MYKLARFIVKKRLFILLFMLLTASVSAWLIPQVEVNYDLSDYLDEESETSRALSIIEEEYDDDGTIFLMAEDVSVSEAEDLESSLADVEGVSDVTFDDTEDHHFVDNNAWLIVSLEYGDFSVEAERIIDEIEANYGEPYNLAFDGPAVNNYELTQAVDEELPLIILMAVSIVIIILTLTARSYIEPIIFLFVIGMAIIINMGTNYFLPDISYVTQSIVAVLQLGLSMDYSIMLLNRYRQEKHLQEDSEEAMITALHASFAPISSSSLTTVAGMIALMFMSFQIGFDIGSVLAKGILISLITVFLLMPGMLVMFNGLYDRLLKRSLTPKGRALAKISSNNKHIIPLLTIALVGVAFMVQQNNTYFYAEEAQTDDVERIEAAFGQNRQLMLVYDDPGAEVFLEKEQAFIERVEGLQMGGEPVLNFVNANATTLYEPLDTTDIEPMVPDEFDHSEIDALFGYYALMEGMQEEDTVNIEALINFLNDIADDNESIDFDDDINDLLDEIDEAMEIMGEEMTYEEAADILEISEIEMQFIYFAYTTDYDDFDAPFNEQLTALFTAIATDQFDPDAPVKLGEIIVYLDMLITEGHIDVDSDQAQTVSDLAFLYNAQEEGVTHEAFADYADLDENEAALIYALFLADEGRVEDHRIALRELVDFVDQERSANPLLEETLSEDDHEEIDALLSTLDEAQSMFEGETSRRMIMTFNVPSEGNQTFTTIENLLDIRDDVFEEDDAYFAGEIMSNYDIKSSFSQDLLIINVITISAIFILVALTFRSFGIPLVVSIIIQGAIWTSMSISVYINQDIFFLSYLVVLAIQMGATVDYGILMTSNYLEKRKFFPKRESVRIAFFNALPTIFTSGLILFTAGISVGVVSSQTSIYSVGYLLARGVAISMVLVMIALPAMLYTFDGFLKKTTYKMRFYKPKNKG